MIRQDDTPPYVAPLPDRMPSIYDSGVTETTRRLSAAVDEIYRLRALLADEATLTEDHLALKSFPRGRRHVAEGQVRRMRAAARGVPEYRTGFNAKRALFEAGADECLTNSQWLEANGFDPKAQP